MNHNLLDVSLCDAALLELEGMSEVENPEVTLVPLLVIARPVGEPSGAVLVIIQDDREEGEVVRFIML